MKELGRSNDCKILPNKPEKRNKEFEDAFERGELKGPTGDALEERKKELQQIARNTMNKTRNINIRLTERDLLRLKSKAVEEGIPYQTLAASILHKTVSK